MITVLFILRYTFEGPDLIIANVKPDDEGVYTCQVITKLDMAEASGTLTLYGKIVDHTTIVPARVHISNKVLINNHYFYVRYGRAVCR